MPPTKTYEAFAKHFERITTNIERVIKGKREVVRLSVVCLMAEGHLLIEDVPGTGKTMLAKSLARSLSCSFRRIQFTPDLLPTDITGVQVISASGRETEFRPGPVFAQIVLGDEINRASPKTQAALLECMEERQVTLDGETYPLERPFMVIATQNPIEHEGTYPLPEAEVDRFLMRIRVGYPSSTDERGILDVHGSGNPLEDLDVVAKSGDVVKMTQIAAQVHVADSVKGYIVDILNGTREHGDALLGASPRSGLAILRASRALAAAETRDFVKPDDVKRLASPVLDHRIILTPEAQLSGRVAADVVSDAVSAVAVPRSR